METLSIPAPARKVHRPSSADGSTRPLRSSPLAGPALNRLLVPTLVVSTETITAPPLCHLSGQSLDSSSTQSFHESLPRRSPITGGMRSSAGRTQSLYMPSENGQRFSTTTITTTRASEWAIDPLQNPIPPRKTRLRPQTSTGVSSLRHSIYIVEEEEISAEIPTPQDISNSSSTSDITPNSRSNSLAQDNSWYTANPYEVTPRFSRLGLSASGVVMPVSVKEHRRMSKPATQARPRTSPSTNTNTTTTPTKRFAVTPVIKSPAPTRIRLRSHSPPPPLSRHQPLPSPTLLHPQSQPQPRPDSLSRPVSTGSSSSETSSLASASQRDIPTPVSSTTSAAPSLTRSRNSGDSLSTSYESWPPTTPPPERDTAFPPPITTGDGIGEECEKDKGEEGPVDGDILRGQMHYSDVDGKVRHLASQPQSQLPPPPQPPTSTPNLNLLQSQTTLPSQKTTTPTTTIIKQDQDSSSQRKQQRQQQNQKNKLVRIKLQPPSVVDFDIQPPFGCMKTTTTTTPVITTTTMAEVGIGVVNVPGIHSPVLPVDLVIPPVTKKKRSMFKKVFKSLFGGR